MRNGSRDAATQPPNIEGIQAVLERDLPDGRWLATLRVLRPTGVADLGQIMNATDLSRGKLATFLGHAHELAEDGILSEVPFAVTRPGRRGRPSTVYRLGDVGAALLRANGHDDAHACGLTTETQIAHARGVLDVRLAAQAEGLTVATERELGYSDDGEQRVLRPDNLITLPDGTQALFEVEQKADLTLLRRVRESVRHKCSFFTSPQADDVSRHVRVLIDLPHGKPWDQTMRTWERATAIAAEDYGGHLPFHIAAIPMLDFLEDPDWAEPPDGRRWESLFDPAQTSAFEPTSDNETALVKSERKPRSANIPTALKRRSARDDYLIMEAFWFHLCQEGRDLMYTNQHPSAHPAFFSTMGVIYAASHPPDATPWERALHPHASLYLLQQYLRMHPRLRQALSKGITRGQHSIKWSTPAITHRMQIVIDDFLRYHGLRSGGAIRVHVLGPWERDDGRGNFGVRVRIEPEVLMGTDDGVVPTREEAQFAGDSLAWVLNALFAYASDIGIKRARFW